MQQEAHKTTSGFGKNTNGLGLVIIAAVAVVIALFCWNFWKGGPKEADHYRLNNEKAATKHGENSTLHEGEASETFAILNPGELGTMDAAGNFIYAIGDTIALKLPNNTYLKVGSKSTEAKLIKFLTEGNVDTVDKTKGWITCDRTFFETGKAMLTPDSKNQITNIAAILNAFPAANLKVGGYTDNIGSEASNMKLSEERSKMVADAIAATPVKNVLAHEGYGPMHPISSNDTKEGQALNRRVDLRVTKK